MYQLVFLYTHYIHINTCFLQQPRKCGHDTCNANINSYVLTISVDKNIEILTQALNISNPYLSRSQHRRF